MTDSRLKGLLYTGLGNFAPPLVALVTAPIIAQSLGVQGRGQVAAAQSTLLLLASLGTFGLPDAVTFFTARKLGPVRRILQIASSLSLITGSLAILLGVMSVRWLSGGSQDLQKLILISFIALLPTLLIGLLRGAAIGALQWRTVAIERGLSALFRLILVCALALTGSLTVLTAVVVNAIYPLLGAFVYLRALRSPTLSRSIDSSLTPRQLAGYSSRVWMGSIAGVLLSRLDQIIITPLASVQQLGLYAVAVTVAELPLVINNTIREFTFGSDASDSNDHVVGQLARLSGWMCAIISLGIGITAHLWIGAVFGHGFESALPILYVLLAATAVGPPGSVAGAALSARGYPHLRSYSLIIALSVTVVLLPIGASLLGGLGAALATLIANLVSSNTNIYFLTKRTTLRFVDFYRLSIEDVKFFSKQLLRVTRMERNR